MSPRTTGSPFSPQILAKYSAPTPKAPASSVAQPLFMHFDRVPPIYNNIMIQI